MSAWPRSIPPLELTALYRDKVNKTVYLGPTEFPDPTLSEPRAHVIQVCAVALTHGELDWPTTHDRPIPGYEYSGYVVSAPAHSPFTPGLQVYGHTSFDCLGNARPYTLALFQELCIQPTHLSWEQCANVPLGALTAFQALFDHGLLERPAHTDHWTPINKRCLPESNLQKLTLITGASGEVGAWAVQLAARAGAGHIVATCPASDVPFVRSLAAAHEVLDEAAEGNLERWARSKFHIVLDCVGGATLRAAWRVVHAEGRIISVATPAICEKPPRGVSPGVTTGWFIVTAAQNELELIATLLNYGLLRAPLDGDNVFDMEDYERALERLRSGSRGKVVLRVNMRDPRPVIELLKEYGSIESDNDWLADGADDDMDDGDDDDDSDLDDLVLDGEEEEEEEQMGAATGLQPPPPPPPPPPAVLERVEPPERMDQGNPLAIPIHTVGVDQ
ncbi:hypothetical protein B0H63DRAFT_525613 [Podospora didyma]|uniref:Enoyl reductase (ER) domain-containing protein n=1 Tax=Podospora didyma TaxID=330526 RepID=A0AAE0KKX8_9PEZI|nr:hypothetical protein B0H63DRAFT_525613 [Podospora didyma]